jgi:hypothetical protein
MIRSQVTRSSKRHEALIDGFTGDRNFYFSAIALINEEEKKLNSQITPL